MQNLSFIGVILVCLSKYLSTQMSTPPDVSIPTLAQGVLCVGGKTVNGTLEMNPRASKTWLSGYRPSTLTTATDKHLLNIKRTAGQVPH